MSQMSQILVASVPSVASVSSPGSRGQARSLEPPRASAVVVGKLTLGLFNTYDPKQWQDIMRITLCRAAPVALAFDADVAAFGFPFEQARLRGAKESEPLRSTADIVRFVVETTSIGEGGEYFRQLAKEDRFHVSPIPTTAFPTRYGRVVPTTPNPAPGKATTPLDVAKQLHAGKDQLLVFGLGPRGLSSQLLEASPIQLEITGKGISMETATALGALPAMIAAHLQHL